MGKLLCFSLSIVFQLFNIFMCSFTRFIKLSRQHSSLKIINLIFIILQAGGLLYSIGGYTLPFAILGAALFLCAIMTLLILPADRTEKKEDKARKSIIHILKVPGIQVCSLGIAATSASIGFISATLEPHLRQFDLTAIQLGVVFVVNGGTYALSAPFGE
jgi:hypothetical protein